MVKIETEKNKNYHLIRIDGDVDASSSIFLDEAISGAVENGAKKILVDGSELNYMSSAGLGVFMSYLQDFEKQGIQLILFGLNEKVKHVFQILGLDQLVKIVDDLTSATTIIDEV